MLTVTVAVGVNVAVNEPDLVGEGVIICEEDCVGVCSTMRRSTWLFASEITEEARVREAGVGAVGLANRERSVA